MGKKGGNSKKDAGNARKAEAAAQKAAEQEALNEANEAAQWEQGSKNNSKKEADAAKKAEEARKRAEKKALLEEEEAENGGRDQPKNNKGATKKSRGLDLSQLDDEQSPTSPNSASTLNASGIDNALDALSLASPTSADKVDKHPERRFAAAYAKYEARRLEQMKEDGSGIGLRMEQRKNRIRKEFDKSSENPFNQVTAAYNATSAELADIKAAERAKIEERLGE